MVDWCCDFYSGHLEWVVGPEVETDCEMTAGVYGIWLVREQRNGKRGKWGGIEECEMVCVSLNRLVRVYGGNEVRTGPRIVALHFRQSISTSGFAP